MKALRLFALWLSLAFAVLLLAPNPNLPFEDDLGLLKLLAWPAFAALFVGLHRANKVDPPKFLTLFVACSLVGSMHTSATVIHFTSDHHLEPLLKPVANEAADSSYGRTQESPPTHEVRRRRFFSHGSGSYVFESLWIEGQGRGIEMVFSGNQPTGPLPNCVVPLKTLPHSTAPQYWVAANQADPAQSLLLTVDKDKKLRQNSGYWLLLAFGLVLLPWGLAVKNNSAKGGWILLGLWCLVYQPWWAWMW